MRYIRIADQKQAETLMGHDFSGYGSIARDGSVTTMHKEFGWQPKGQVRIGPYIYNVGTDNVNRLRDAKILQE